MADKIVLDETALVTPAGTELVRVSTSPYNTNSTNRKILLSDLKAWMEPDFDRTLELDPHTARTAIFDDGATSVSVSPSGVVMQSVGGNLLSFSAGAGGEVSTQDTNTGSLSKFDNTGRLTLEDGAGTQIFLDVALGGVVDKITHDATFGINTASPTHQLEVIGNFMVDNLIGGGGNFMAFNGGELLVKQPGGPYVNISALDGSVICTDATGDLSTWIKPTSIEIDSLTEQLLLTVNLVSFSSGGYDSSIKTIRVAINAAATKTLNSIPVAIVPSPGVGYAIETISATITRQASSVTFTSATVFLKANGADSAQFSCQDILQGTNNASRLFETSSGAVTGEDSNVVDTAPLELTADSDSATGDGNLIVYVFYRIIKL